MQAAVTGTHLLKKELLSLIYVKKQQFIHTVNGDGSKPQKS